MTEYQQLLAAVIADRADDTPRLVLADWLQENGQDARAEFIRLQIREPVPAGTPTEDYPGRQRELWSGLCERLGVPLAFTGSVDYFRRGFLTHTRCTAEGWLEHADALFWHPSQHRPCPETAQPLEKVKLTTLPELEPRARGGRWVEYRLVGGREERPYGTDAGVHVVADELLRIEFPGVKFELPPSPQAGRIVDLPADFLTRDYAAEDMAAMREAGRRAAVRREWAALNAITRPPESD